jgi:hypothetical protein
MEDKETIEKIIDQLYLYYEAEISLQNIMYIHPMFYNGTFSENNEYQLSKPEELMSKEEFISKLNNESNEYRWKTAFNVLYSYILRNK